MEIEGKITHVSAVQRGVSQKGNAWARQEAVLETAGQYPKRCAFTIVGEERINRFALTVGEECRVSFDINAREYNGRWYNDVTAWDIAPLASRQPQPVRQGQQAQPMQAAAPQYSAQPAGTAREDELPF